MSCRFFGDLVAPKKCLLIFATASGHAGPSHNKRSVSDLHKTTGASGHIFSPETGIGTCLNDNFVRVLEEKLTPDRVLGLLRLDLSFFFLVDVDGDKWRSQGRRLSRSERVPVDAAKEWMSLDMCVI